MQENEQQLGSLLRQELHVKILNMFVTWQILMQNILEGLHTKLLKIKKYFTLEKKLTTCLKEIDPYETLYEYGDGMMGTDERGMTRENHEQYMYRLNQEDKAIDKRKLKALNKQVGGSHYKDFKIMPIEYITQNKLDFCEGNIVKYISRHEKKNGAEDIRKVIHYAELILQQKYGKDF
jgi:hypothetical protein